MSALTIPTLWPLNHDRTRIHAPVKQPGEMKLGELIALVDRLVDRIADLTQRLALAERERDEALEVGHNLADQRDALISVVSDAAKMIARANGDLCHLAVMKGAAQKLVR